MKNIFLLISILFVISFLSCKKESSQINIDKFHLKTKLLTMEEVKKIKDEVVQFNSITTLNYSTNSTLNSSNIEYEAILEPAIENGKLIHEEMIAFLQNSDYWNELSQSDIDEITNLTNEQYAQLSIALAVTPNEISGTATEAIDWSHVRSCASALLIGGDIYYLLVENPKALLSARGVANVLKQVGFRYVGWVSLILTAWDFYDCIN